MILHSQILGEGKPFIILHGFLGMSDNWKTLGRRFSELGYQMHLVDQRNHGHSFHDDAFSYNIMAEDLKAYFDHHNITSAVVLGHSMGGKTAMEFASRYPEQVNALIVADIGPKAYPPHHQDILKALSSLDFDVINSRGAADKELSQYIKEMGIRQFLLKNLYWIEKGRLGLRANLPVLIERYDEVGAALEVGSLYDGPTIFLGGEKSNYIEPMDELQIRQHFPKASIETVSKAGHWLHAENPQEFYEKVNSFLNEN